MYLKEIGFNATMLRAAARKKELHLMHKYLLIVRATAGKGYIGIKEFRQYLSDFCGISDRTGRRWVTVLIEKRAVRCKKGVLYPISKKKAKSNYAERLRESGIEDISRRSIVFPEDVLKDYTLFRDHFIRQYALLMQRRFRHMVSLQRRDKIQPDSLIKEGKIETSMDFIRNPKKVGCSISKLHEALLFNKATISKALKGFTIKQSKGTYTIEGKVVRAKYRPLIDCMTRKKYLYSYEGVKKDWFSYNKETDTYRLYRRVASRITVDSWLRRENRR